MSSSPMPLPRATRLLRGDVPTEDGKHFFCGQFLPFPFLALFIRGVLRRFLVAEFCDQRLRFGDVSVQLGVRLQLIHVFGEFVLEQFKLFLIYSVCLAHQVETQPVLHRPCLADTFPQFFRRYEFLRIVCLHPDVDRFAEEYHYLRVEVVCSDGGEGFRGQLRLADNTTP